MKTTRRVAARSPFWSRLLGLLIAFAIIAVLVFGGVNNLMGELSAVYQELGESQTALARAESRLSHLEMDVAAVESQLATTEKVLASKASALELSRRQHVEKNRLIQALAQEQWDLKRALGEAAGAVAQSNRELRATQNALRASQAELQRHLSQPKLSVVVTTERMMQSSYRERFAASQVKLYAEGAEGMVYFKGQQMMRDIQKQAQYAERTQVVITQTAPGHDVLRCLSDASLGCSRVIAAQASQKQMAYAYQSHFSAQQMQMLWMQ